MEQLKFMEESSYAENVRRCFYGLTNSTGIFVLPGECVAAILFLTDRMHHQSTVRCSALFVANISFWDMRLPGFDCFFK